MAESERFELSIQRSPYTRFPGVLLQPLGQLSTMLYQKKLFTFTSLISLNNRIYYTRYFIRCQHFFLNLKPKRKQEQLPCSYYIKKTHQRPVRFGRNQKQYIHASVIDGFPAVQYPASSAVDINPHPNPFWTSLC